MKSLAVVILNLALLLSAALARADLTIEITQGMDNPTAIAVSPLPGRERALPPWTWRG